MNGAEGNHIEVVAGTQDSLMMVLLQIQPTSGYIPMNWYTLHRNTWTWIKHYWAHCGWCRKKLGSYTHATKAGHQIILARSSWNQELRLTRKKSFLCRHNWSWGLTEPKLLQNQSSHLGRQLKVNANSCGWRTSLRRDQRSKTKNVGKLIQKCHNRAVGM